MKNNKTTEISKSTGLKSDAKSITIKKLPYASLLILEYLLFNGRSSRHQLLTDLDFGVKSIKFYLRKLRKQGFIIKQPNLLDMRSVNYFINPDKYYEIIEVIKNHDSSFDYINMSKIANRIIN